MKVELTYGDLQGLAMATGDRMIKIYGMIDDAKQRKDEKAIRNWQLLARENSILEQKLYDAIESFKDGER